MTKPISIALIETLIKGEKRLSKEAVGRIIGFVKSRQTVEGAFADKSFMPDVYYTSFGWALAFALGIETNREKCAEYLALQRLKTLDLVHCSAFARCSLLLKLMEKNRPEFMPDSLSSITNKHENMMAELPSVDPYSPYNQFVMLTMREDNQQLINSTCIDCNRNIRPLNTKLFTDEIIGAMSHYRLASGGYSNIKNASTATTNATVAALSVLGQINGYNDNADIRFLKGLQEVSGGFSAAAGSPIPDLLSTATSLFILKQYGLKPTYSPDDFVEAHWLDNGGFAATLLDDDSDVEYTFYGLLALGTL